jgi:hypothetical protein
MEPTGSGKEWRLDRQGGTLGNPAGKRRLSLIRRTLLLLALALAPGFAHAQSDDCQGDVNHRPHDFPTTSCELEWNPHYSQLVSAAGCHQRTLTCEGCFDCCDAQAIEKIECSCESVGKWSVCVQAVTTVQRRCRNTTCPGTYLDSCP